MSNSAKIGKNIVFFLCSNIVLLMFMLFIFASDSEANSDEPYNSLNDLRQIKLHNQNWQYLQNPSTILRDAVEDKGWQQITIPHSWNAIDAVDTVPGYRRSSSWYRTQITADQTGRYLLHFEAANMLSEVYVNGYLVREHMGGYLGFKAELTHKLLMGQKNDILVRVDNSYRPELIPSQKADFFLYGGITRDVWLMVLPDTHLQDLEISTDEVASGKVSTHYAITLNRTSNTQEHYKILSRVLDADGSEVLSHHDDIFAQNSLQTFRIMLPTLLNPELWSVDSPSLYTLQVELQDTNGNRVDKIENRYGYRWFEMRAGEGFFVNGKKMLIRGTHLHEDAPGVGPALNNAQHRARMEQIKKLGANFVRLAHYPQDPEVYRAADELGLVLWDELPWVRGGKGDNDWEANTERYLKQQVKQNYNHPSIAFWSLGNEMDWEEDFEGGGDPAVVTPYIEKLNTIVKSLDRSRLTTLRKYPQAAHIVDVFSPSIWTGWYGGAYSQYADAIEMSMQQYPYLVHMEYGGSSHVGRHTENPIGREGLSKVSVSAKDAMNQAGNISVAKDSDWSESYIVDLFDWHLRVSETTPGFAGNAQWAFRDFATPLRPENPIPYVNQKGLLTRDGKKKDAYYVFASYWSKEPFCYIMSKTWTHRQGPASGRPIRVYCNTTSAELFLNGSSLGEKDRDINIFPAAGLVWQVPLESGENHLTVVGKGQGYQVEDRLTIHYYIGSHGALHKVRVTAKENPNGGLLIEAQAVDKDNNRVLSFNERAFFSNLTEYGSFQQHQGTPSGSVTVQFASGYAAIVFYPGEMPTVLELLSQNVKGVYLKIAAE